MSTLSKYRLVCTLSFGDIYGQIIVWLIVIFVSLSASMGFMGASKPIFALATVGLILVLTLPFLLFAFVTTLLNHIELMPIDPATAKTTTISPTSVPASQRPAQAAG
ncbi:MAG: hypothetical protein IGS48_11545 [Oscillatoriales cyanobacterium C42_A2020_001]|nr:hypothetical protein [Leptolyngbyaceae cyanobacterium C42_A2020_001]